MPAKPRSVRGRGLIAASVLVMLLSHPAFAWGPGDVGDKSADPDGDKLDNLAEFAEGTDPLDPDTDGGGCWDGWEVGNGFDPTDPDDDALDADRDGWSNLREFREGTDPRRANTDGDSYLVDSLDPHPFTHDDNPGLAPGAAWTGAGVGWAETNSSEPMGQGQTAGQGAGQALGQGNGQGRTQFSTGRPRGQGGYEPWPDDDDDKDSDTDGIVEFLDALA